MTHSLIFCLVRGKFFPHFFFRLLFVHSFDIWLCCGPEQIANNSLLAIIVIVAVDVQTIVRARFAYAWCVCVSIRVHAWSICMASGATDMRMVSICGLHCWLQLHTTAFKRCFAALERNYDHTYVHFSIEFILYILFLFIKWMKRRKKNTHTHRILEIERKKYISIYNLLLFRWMYAPVCNSISSA